MLINISLTYNPFLEKNKSILLIDGKPQNKDYLDYNLQAWISSFFDNLKTEFKGESFNFKFTGLEIDCQDVEEVVENARSQGMKINFKKNIVPYTATERLTQLENLLAQIKENPMFSEAIQKHNSFKALEENVFDVFVVATMSSGKSTFINAMLGCDLLPAQNEATTAVISEILHNPKLEQGQFNASRKNKAGEYLDRDIRLDLTEPDKAKSAQNLLSSWNGEADNKEIDDTKRTATIHLEGRLIGINIPNKLKLRLSDTPGPNNSNELNHSSITLNKIKDTQGNNPLIIYLINGVQIGTFDDDRLLKSIESEMKRHGKLATDRFIFLMNRMDDFFQKNENIGATIERVKEYLNNHHIYNPQIYPVSARLAKFERIYKLNLNLLDDIDLVTLEYLNKIIFCKDDHDLTKYMTLNSQINDYLKSTEDSAIKRSGITAVERGISNYIEKYNEPYRIMQIAKAIGEIFEQNQAKFDQIVQLKDKTQEQLNDLVSKLKNAEKNLEKAAEINEQIQKLEGDEILLSDEVVEFFKHQNELISSAIASCQKKTPGALGRKEAEDLLNALSKLLVAHFEQLYAEVEKLNRKTQSNQLEKLNTKYKEFVSSYFGKLFNGIQIELIENFEIQALSLQHYLKLDNSEIITEVSFRQEKIERGFFEKLLTFDFSDRYCQIEEKHEFVNFSKKLAKLDSVISPHLERLSNKLKQNARALTKVYCEELNRQFKSATTKFIQDLQENTQKEGLEENIRYAEQQLAYLKNLEIILNRNRELYKGR
jgi:hypothetical protein